MVEFWHPLVGLGLVRVDRRARFDVLADEALEGRRVGVLDNAGRNPVGIAILGACDRGHVHRAAAGQLFPLRQRLVLPLAADMRLVDLDRAEKLAGLLLEGEPQPVQHEPGSLLADAELAMQPHRRDALDVDREEVNADRPCPVRHFRPRHDGAGAQREKGLALAVPAAVRHALVLDVRLHVEAAAIRTIRSLRPANRLNPLPRRILVAEHVGDQLHKRINEVKDVYVRRDDLNQHITRLERAVEDVKGELREMRRHHELVITTMQANTELLKTIAKHQAPS